MIIKKTRLESFRHIEHKDDAEWVTCYDDKGGGHQSKTWWNCIRGYEEFGLCPEKMHRPEING